ncbi:hypothetical protein [Dongia sp. agr-C8]
MKHHTSLFAAFLTAGLLALSSAQAETMHMEMPTPPEGSAKVVATDAALRNLWVNHIFWVRNVVTATLAKNAAAAKVAEEEVVANARGIADAIKPFYGDQAGDALFGLLAGHYGAIKTYLTATAAGDRAGQQKATENLLANADQIATFLSGANPNLPRDAVLGLLQAHGGHHIDQIQELKAKQYAEEAKTWAEMQAHMYVIADALAGAIAKQFPEKF